MYESSEISTSTTLSIALFPIWFWINILSIVPQFFEDFHRVAGNPSYTAEAPWHAARNCSGTRLTLTVWGTSGRFSTGNRCWISDIFTVYF